MKSSKVTQNSHVIFLVFIVIATVVSRLYGLTFKPIHFDESINGWFSSQVQQMGYFKYDPSNYHGPLYFYILRLFEFIGGRSLETLRAVPSIFAIASLLLFVVPVTGAAIWRRWVAVLLLISPAFVFFGRSGIHEMPFVFFQLVFALGVLRALEKKDATAISCLLIGLFGMLSLKETFVISLFSFAVGVVFVGPHKLKSLLKVSDWQKAWSPHLSWLLAILIGIFVVLFTGFFRNMNGLVDFFRAFLPWMKTGTQGNGHDKAFFYWLQTLWYAEPLALFGFALTFFGVFSKNISLRVISVFSLVQLVVYSVIPYKTVWCILSLVWGFYFVIAYVAQEIRSSRTRYVFYAMLGVAAAFNIVSLYKSSYRYPIDLKHPYVYVNSTYAVPNLMDFISKAGAQEQIKVQIGMEEQWPWPWLLRDFQIKSYEICGRKVIPELDVYFCDPKDVLAVEGPLKEAYWKVEFEFRQERGSPSLVYLKKSVFPVMPFPNAVEVGGEF